MKTRTPTPHDGPATYTGTALLPDGRRLLTVRLAPGAHERLAQGLTSITQVDWPGSSEPALIVLIYQADETPPEFEDHLRLSAELIAAGRLEPGTRRNLKYPMVTRPAPRTRDAP